MILASSYSHDLPCYGLKVGLTNYAAGALDGGLDIPRSDKRFAGFNKDNKQLDVEIHRKYIYSGHVADYTKDEPEKYQSHFGGYIKKEVYADDLEELYKKVHADIKADPFAQKPDKEPPKQHNRYNPKKLTYDERKASLIQRLNALNSTDDGDEYGEDEEDED